MISHTNDAWRRARELRVVAEDHLDRAIAEFRGSHQSAYLHLRVAEVAGQLAAVHVQRMKD